MCKCGFQYNCFSTHIYLKYFKVPKYLFTEQLITSLCSVFITHLTCTALEPTSVVCALWSSYFPHLPRFLTHRTRSMNDWQSQEFPKRLKRNDKKSVIYPHILLQLHTVRTCRVVNDCYCHSGIDS